MSAVVYAVATGIAVLAWAAWDALQMFAEGRYLDTSALALQCLAVWFVVAGIGLRAVRHRNRSRAASTQSVE